MTCRQPVVSFLNLEKLQLLTAMRKIISLLLLMAILQSCSTKDKKMVNLQKMLRECDEVVVVLDNRMNNSNTTIRLNDTSQINIFTELITGEKEKIDDSCDPIGDLLFKKEGKVVFNAEFSIPIKALNTNCLYVRYNLQLDTFRHRFTYRAGQLLTGLKYQNTPEEASDNQSQLREN